MRGLTYTWNGQPMIGEIPDVRLPVKPKPKPRERIVARCPKCHRYVHCSPSGYIREHRQTGAGPCPGSLTFGFYRRR